MLHPNLLCLKGPNLAGDINKDSLNNPALTELSFRDKSFCGKFIGLFIINIDNNHYWILAVFGEKILNLNIAVLVGASSNIPSKELFFDIDLSEHLIHLLMVDMVQKPDPRRLGVFVEGKGVGVGQLIHSVDILAQQSANHSFVFLVSNGSLEVVNH